MMTYPLKFRQKVLETRERDGLTIAEVADRFCVGVASVVRWLKSPEPKPGRNKPAQRSTWMRWRGMCMSIPTLISMNAPRGWGARSAALAKPSSALA